MPILKIRHRTIYRYNRPVKFGPHRLMLRPRESRDLRLLSMDLAIRPSPVVAWAHDVTGNVVATVSFADMASELVIECLIAVLIDAVAWPVFDVSASAIQFPFAYSAEERVDLGAMAERQYADPMGRMKTWSEGFVRSRPTDTLSLLKDINEGIVSRISYEVRQDEGTQSSLETLKRGCGACRDIAVLFAETVRTLGFGARLVSGYLHDPDHTALGAGATHAWAEVFVPGAGWITFDPTNRRVGGANLIPVAVGRDIRQISPIIGEYVGAKDAFDGMSVEVSVNVQ